MKKLTPGQMRALLWAAQAAEPSIARRGDASQHSDGEPSASVLRAAIVKLQDGLQWVRRGGESA